MFIFCIFAFILRKKILSSPTPGSLLGSLQPPPLLLILWLAFSFSRLTSRLFLWITLLVGFQTSLWSLCKNNPPLHTIMPFSSPYLLSFQMTSLLPFSWTHLSDTQQSGFQPLHSAGIALSKITNDVLLVNSNHLFSSLFPFDFSNTFDVSDHSFPWSPPRLSCCAENCLLSF